MEFDMVVQQPDMVVQQPDMVVQRPDMVVQQPDMVVQQPDIVVQQPGWSQSVPVAWASCQRGHQWPNLQQYCLRILYLALL